METPIRRVPSGGLTYIRAHIRPWSQLVAMALIVIIVIYNLISNLFKDNNERSPLPLETIKTLTQILGPQIGAVSGEWNSTSD